MTFFKSSILILTTAVLFFVSCKHNKTEVGTSLMKYGIPVTIQAPSDVSISKIGSGNLADVNIKNKTDYDVQVFMSNAHTADLTKLKQLKKEQVITHPEFTKIIEEYDEGFIFEKKSFSGERSFDFSLVKIQGDKEISFEAGNSRPFTESEIKVMVRSILQ